ncbi:hypothetical protein [Pseudoclavibacter sp. AY1F1]|uniref:hypothetical protein n=1 Tax=Pseudoclavibacter sp. AY1F1 TaxID=2080583 RepID=UPI0011B04817|nr:hypothetical protein [Pseudoclavibacter sp. AY1F1]
MQGYDFVAQGGGVNANSKATFRQIAASSGVAASDGFVCADSGEMSWAIKLLLSEPGSACMVKRVFDTAASGNEIICRADSSLSDSVGSLSVRVLSDVEQSVEDYVSERWDWASFGSREMVVVEGVVRDSLSVYVETDISDRGIEINGSGLMVYDPAPSRQVIPLSSREPWFEDLHEGAVELSRVLFSMGYRGHASCDAVVDQESKVTFTEINAQITGSTHVHQGVLNLLEEGPAQFSGVVCEFVWSEDWHIQSFVEMIDLVDALGLAYNADSCTGVILTLPFSERHSSSVFCVAERDEGSALVVRDSLAESLSSR